MPYIPDCDHEVTCAKFALIVLKGRGDIISISVIKFLPITRFARDMRETLARHFHGVGTCSCLYLVFDMLVVFAQHEPAGA